MAFGKRKKNRSADIPPPVVEVVSPPPVAQDESAVVPEQKKKRKPYNRRRNTEMKFRITEEEKLELEALAAAAHMSRTDFIMESVRNSPITVVTVEGVPDLIKELRAQGRNLNQAVKLANERHDTRNLAALGEAVAACDSAYQSILVFCEQWNAQILKLQEGVLIDGNSGTGEQQGDAQQGD